MDVQDIYQIIILKKKKIVATRINIHLLYCDAELE